MHDSKNMCTENCSPQSQDPACIDWRSFSTCNVNLDLRMCCELAQHRLTHICRGWQAAVSFSSLLLSSLKLSGAHVYEPQIRARLGAGGGVPGVRQPGKGNSNSLGARPVNLISPMMKWIRTSSLSIPNFLSGRRQCLLLLYHSRA